MATERFDRSTLQILPTEDIKLLASRINEKLRFISEAISRLEGRSGPITTKNSLTVRSDGYTLMDLEGQLAGKAAFSATTGVSRSFEIAKGARREKDGQWVATDTGAVILQLKDDGTMVMYANTGLTIGAAFAPVAAITFPGGTVPHGLVSASHTATGLTTGHVLTATGTNTFAFQGQAASGVSFTPTGSVAASNVQSAIAEVDSEKLALTGGTVGDFQLTNSTAFLPQLRLINSTAQGNSSGQLIFDKTNTNPSDGNVLGSILWRGYNEQSSGQYKTWAEIVSDATDVSNGTEDATMYFYTLGNGTFQNEMYIQDNLVFVQDTLSAATLVDRTAVPKDKQESYDIINSFAAKDGKLDKDLLHSAAKQVRTVRKPILATLDGVTQITSTELAPATERNVSVVLSALMEVVKDLAARVAALEA